jgi:hypothetical protein
MRRRWWAGCLAGALVVALGTAAGLRYGATPRVLPRLPDLAPVATPAGSITPSRTAAGVFERAAVPPADVRPPDVPAMQALVARVLGRDELDVCGVGVVRGEWKRDPPEAEEAALDLPASITRQGEEAAERLIEGLLRSSEPRAHAAGLVLSGRLSELATLAARSNDPFALRWTLALCQSFRHAGAPACGLVTPRLLARHEPDNAVSWMAVLAHEPAAADEALHRMATATHFDEHFGELTREVDRAGVEQLPGYVQPLVLSLAFAAEAQLKPVTASWSAHAVGSAWPMPTCASAASRSSRRWWVKARPCCRERSA